MAGALPDFGAIIRASCKSNDESQTSNEKNFFLSISGNLHKISTILSTDLDCVENYFKIAQAVGMHPMDIYNNKQQLCIDLPKKHRKDFKFGDGFYSYTFFRRVFGHLAKTDFSFGKEDLILLLRKLGLNTAADKINEEVGTSEPIPLAPAIPKTLLYGPLGLNGPPYEYIHAPLLNSSSINILRNERNDAPTQDDEVIAENATSENIVDLSSPPPTPLEVESPPLTESVIALMLPPSVSETDINTNNIR